MNTEEHRELALTVKITSKGSRKVDIFRACPRHYEGQTFSVSQKPPKNSPETTPMALATQIELCRLTSDSSKTLTRRRN